MERKKPLRAQKGLTQKTRLVARSALKAKKALAKNSSLRPRSKKMEKIYEERRPFVVEMLQSSPYCRVFWDENCFERATDVHEIKPRSQGGEIVGGDPSNYLTVCRYCHTMIDLYPEEAHRRGFRKWSWEN